MSKQVQGTKITPHNDDTLIIKDSEDGDKLKEISFDGLRIASIDLTGTFGNVDSYSIFADAAKSTVIGSYTITNGADGTGTSAPTYSASTVYAANDLVTDGNNFLFRSRLAGNQGNTLPTDNVDSASWYHVKTQGKVRQIITAGQTVEEGVHYYVDMSLAAFTLVIPANVKEFTITDLSHTFNDANKLSVFVGVDSVTFGLAAAGQTYTFIRSGTTFIIYDRFGHTDVRNV